ncbi:MAG: PP2C family serine/threonine-protein phosphatase [Planctomycetota bacterium]
MRIAFAALTDVGLVRQNNEDTYVLCDLSAGTCSMPPPVSTEGATDAEGLGVLFAVADGMGGALAGEVASQMAVETLAEAAREIDPGESRDDARDRVTRAIGLANQRIFESSQSNPQQRGMGTTLTAVLMRDGQAHFFQVGDSKGYLFRNDDLHQMTNAHSLIDTLVQDNVISAEDAENLQGGKNIILRALGAEDNVKIDLSGAPLGEGDIVVLCSDGLHGCVKQDRIQEIVRGSLDPGKIADELVAEARANGGPDNITVGVLAVLEVEESDEPAGFVSKLTEWFRGRKSGE